MVRLSLPLVMGLLLPLAADAQPHWAFQPRGRPTVSAFAAAGDRAWRPGARGRE